MSKFQTWLPPCLLIALLSQGKAAALSDAAKADELLAKYQAFVAEFESVRFDSDTTTYQKGGPFAEWTWVVTSHAAFSRKGDRWRFLIHEVGYNYYDHKKIPFDLETEQTFDGRSYFMVDRDDREARELPEIDETSARQRLAGHLGRRVETQASAEIDTEKPAAARDYAVQNETCLFYGYIPGDRVSIIDLFHDKRSRLTAGADALGGRTCDILRGATSHGVITLWLDRESNHIPIRILIRRSGDDLVGNTPMRKQKPHGDDKRVMPNLPMLGYDIDAEFKHSTIGGQDTISGCLREDRFTFERGVTYGRRIEMNLTRVDFNPKPEDLEPTLAIPEGNYVSIRNAPGIAAKWSGGKLVMNYDKPTVAALKANWVSEEIPTPAWRRPIVLTTTVLLIIAVSLLARRLIVKRVE